NYHKVMDQMEQVVTHCPHLANRMRTVLKYLVY
ncbi:uncharacterized protein METZ01_LOCUS468732, partial [marine metagenome]